jgi:hypothetical protein
LRWMKVREIDRNFVRKIGNQGRSFWMSGQMREFGESEWFEKRGFRLHSCVSNCGMISRHSG